MLQAGAALGHLIAQASLVRVKHLIFEMILPSLSSKARGHKAIINLWNRVFGMSPPRLEQKGVFTYSVAFGPPESLRSFAPLVSL